MQPVCNFSCGNGTCVADNVCRCFNGWTGDRCDQGMHILHNKLSYFNNNNTVFCAPTCARGTCLPNNICVCDPGWTGQRCRIGMCFYKVHGYIRNFQILTNAYMLVVISFVTILKDRMLVIVILVISY